MMIEFDKITGVQALVLRKADKIYGNNEICNRRI